jgi:hypothetical protein
VTPEPRGARCAGLAAASNRHHENRPAEHAAPITPHPDAVPETLPFKNLTAIRLNYERAAD